ncbi:MAG: PIG-L family deacetylase [Caldilineales bacterium]|nr:PIG-L family deacetylase [Caldilineales bacterium]
MPYLILSPHSDDAVLSCGGAITEWRQQGEPTTVVTLFDGVADPPYSAFINQMLEQWGNPPDIRRLRRAEDAAALAKLGAGDCSLGLLEAGYRQDGREQWLYQSLSEILDQVHAHDWRLSAQIVRQIESQFDLAEWTIVAPLAIGGHVDHQLAFDAAVSLIGADCEVMFYEDYPYAATQSSYARRMDEIEGKEPLVIELASTALFIKIEALSYYRSQILNLFVDYANMVSDVIEFARYTGNGRYAERFWRIANPDRRFANTRTQRQA